MKLGRAEGAAALFARAWEIRPAAPQASAELGRALHALGRFRESEECLLNSLKADSSSPQVHNNLGIAIYSQNRPEEAIPHFHRATELLPGYAHAFRNLGSSLNDVGDLDGAERAYGRALELSPEYHAARVSLGFVKLMKGDYPKGFALYESRFQSGDRYVAEMYGSFDSLASVPRWNGEDIRDRTILAVTEQGAGDTLMVMRYLPLLKNLGPASLSVYCEPPLERVLGLVEGVDEVFPKGGEPPTSGFDFHCPLMSLPRIFGTTVATIPDTVPYLAVPATLGEKWGERLAALPGKRVGLVWAGGRAAVIDHKRSVELPRLRPLFDVGGASFVSLQKGVEASKELETGNHPVLDPMAGCEDFLDTAAVIGNLDLVVTVDTSVAHLAGAMGKPVWLMNRFESEWRWMLGRADSPWYPTMRIFRQKTRGDWDGVVEEIREELSRFVLGA